MSPRRRWVPDLFVRPQPDGGWRIELNSGVWPRVLVNRAYHAHVAGHGRDRAVTSFLAERLEAANWLVKSLDRRARTILAVGGRAGRAAGAVPARRASRSSSP